MSNNNSVESIARRAARRYHVDGFAREDLQQEATLAILQAMRVGEKDPSHLYQIATRRLSNLAKRKKMETLGESDVDLLDAVDDQSDVDNAEEFNVSLEKYRNILTSRQYAVLELTFLHGATDCEIAERLHVQVRTIQHARSRALRKIRESNANIF